LCLPPFSQPPPPPPASLPYTTSVFTTPTPLAALPALTHYSHLSRTPFTTYSHPPTPITPYPFTLSKPPSHMQQYPHHFLMQAFVYLCLLFS
jgi:hypothetical protein